MHNKRARRQEFDSLPNEFGEEKRVVCVGMIGGGYMTSFKYSFEKMVRTFDSNGNSVIAFPTRVK